LDKEVQGKIDEGKKLTKGEKQAVKGYELLESELAKEPSRRRAETFQELHETILNEEDNGSLPDEDGAESTYSSESDQDENESSDSNDSELGEASPVDTETTKQDINSAAEEKEKYQKKDVTKAIGGGKANSYLLKRNLQLKAVQPKLWVNRIV